MSQNQKPTKPLVVVCGWCPDAREKTKAAIEAGNEVSHSMCPACTKKMEDLAATKYEKETK